MKSLICFFLVLTLTSLINSQSSMIFDVGTTIHVGTGADICADVVTINGTFTGEGTLCDEGTIPVELTCKVFLEGSYSSPGMTTYLNTSGVIPLNQPYNVTPWNYSGTESVTNIPLGVVDWILVELRSNTTTVAARYAAFLKSDGNIVDLDGASPVKFDGVDNGSYYVVTYHRNHLGIMSSSAQMFNVGSTTSYDFTNGDGSQFYPGNGSGAKLLETGPPNVWGMMGGDSNSSGIVTNSDKDGIINELNNAGYYNGDTNLSGIVTNSDKDLIINNLNKSSSLP